MRTRSPLVALLLALALVAGQSASALHALEHLAPSSAGHLVAGDGVTSPHAHASGVPDGTTPEHVDDGPCALCLLLGTGQALVRSADPFHVPVDDADKVIAVARRAHPRERSLHHPPARGPPVFS